MVEAHGNTLRVRLKKGVVLHNGDGLTIGSEGFNVNGVEGNIVKINKEPVSISSLKGREETAQVSFAKVWGAHTADRTQYDLLKENAIANRKTPTEAEAILWDLLKGNNIG